MLIFRGVFCFSFDTWRASCKPKNARHFPANHWLISWVPRNHEKPDPSRHFLGVPTFQVKECKHQGKAFSLSKVLKMSSFVFIPQMPFLQTCQRSKSPYFCSDNQGFFGGDVTDVLKEDDASSRDLR